VPENIIGHLAPNQEVEVVLSAYPKLRLKGQISFVSPVLDPDTRRNKTRINFSNTDGKLQPNMYATVKVSIPQPNLISIPTSAVLMSDDSTSVFVEIEPWSFERRSVRLGKEDKDQVRVLSGLMQGNRIVINGGIFIND
jgi:cobalt-zinc-cadmium efflux system membrane fusion protein